MKFESNYAEAYLTGDKALALVGMYASGITPDAGFSQAEDLLKSMT